MISPIFQVLMVSLFTLPLARADVCSDAYAAAQTRNATCTVVHNCSGGHDEGSALIIPRTRTDGGIDYYCDSFACNGDLRQDIIWSSITYNCNSTGGGAKPAAPNSEHPTCGSGSIIVNENRVLGETVPLIGTGFSLDYFSSWSTGRVVDYRMNIQVSRTPIRAAVTGYDVKVYNEVGTQVDHQTFSASANQSTTYNWNGLDASSNSTWGRLIYSILLTENATDFNTAVTTSAYVGNFKAKKLGLGGWVPSVWRFYDIASKTLNRGDGSTKTLPTTATAVTGGYRVPEDDASVVYYFDSVGRITSTVTGRTGSAIYTFAYDSNGYLSTITEPFSRVTAFNRDGSGNLTSVTAPNGKVSYFSLDGNGFLAGMTDPNSQAYAMTYSSSGLLLTFTKPNSAVSTFTYDTDGNLVSDSHSGGFSTTLGVSGSNLTITSAMSRVTTSSSVINPAGLSTITHTLPSGGSNYIRYATSSLETNDSGYTDTLNYSGTDPRFGSLARPPSQLLLQGRTITFTHSASLSNSTDPFSIITKTDVATLGSGSTSNQYTSTYTGSTKTLVDSTVLGRTRTRVFDTYERLTSDQIGGLTAKTFSYTNNLLTQIQQGSRTTSLAYDSTSKLLASITDPLSQVTAFTYDSGEHITSVTLPDSRVISYVYDFAGNLTQVTPPSRPDHSYGFNAKEIVSSYLPPPLDTVNNWNTTYSYNNDKQLTQVSRPDGSTIDYNYGSTTGLLNTVGGTPGTYTYSYDSYKRVSQIAGPSLKNVFTYSNQAKEYSSITTYVGATSIGSYQSSFASQGKKSAEYTTGATGSRNISFSYDRDEKLTTAGDITLSYDIPDGKLTGTVLGTFSDYYYYNSFGEVTGYIAQNSGTTFYSYSLTRNALGRITQKMELLNGVTTTYDYSYDVAGRLIYVYKNSTLISTYNYDSNSNINGGSISGVTTYATFDNQDRLTAWNNNTYTYNLNGDLTSKFNTVLSQTTNYTYDVFGNLTQVALPLQTINYEVDPLNVRVGKKISSTLQGRRLHDSQGRLIAELSTSNALLKTYVYASKVNVPDYFIDSSGERYRIFSDYLGSPRVVVKTSTGAVMQLMEHDEFGRIMQDSSPGYTPFGFAGGDYDAATGLVRFGARDYDSETGRWTTKDSVRFDGSDTNLFGYVNQNPTSKIDPKGKTGFFVCVVVNFLQCNKKKNVNNLDKCIEPTAIESWKSASDCLDWAGYLCTDAMNGVLPRPMGGT